MKELGLKEWQGFFERVRLRASDGAFNRVCIKTVRYKTCDKEVNSILQTACSIAREVEDEAFGLTVSRFAQLGRNLSKAKVNLILALHLLDYFVLVLRRSKIFLESRRSIKGDIMALRYHALYHVRTVLRSATNVTHTKNSSTIWGS